MAGPEPMIPGGLVERQALIPWSGIPGVTEVVPAFGLPNLAEQGPAPLKAFQRVRGLATPRTDLLRGVLGRCLWGRCPRAAWGAWAVSDWGSPTSRRRPGVSGLPRQQRLAASRPPGRSWWSLQRAPAPALSPPSGPPSVLVDGAPPAASPVATGDDWRRHLAYDPPGPAGCPKGGVHGPAGAGNTWSGIGGIAGEVIMADRGSG